MARRRRPIQAGPVHLPVKGRGISVPLDYPIRVGSRVIRRIHLLPPTLDDLIMIRSLDAVGAAEILAPMSGIEPEVIRALRWTDIEVAMTAAFDLLPPDLASLIRGDQPVPEATPAPPADPVIEDLGDGPVDLADFMIDPTEIAVHG